MAHKKKRSGGTRRRAAGRKPDPGAASRPLAITLSYAVGPRVLREQFEARPAKDRRGDVVAALSLLEAEYERMAIRAREAGLPQPSGPNAKRAAAKAVKVPTVGPRPEVGFVPTPPELVDAMLALAQVGTEDIVYDLGCGDGRIVIAAAKQYGARGVGFDIDPERISEATARAAEEGVADLVEFRQVDLFTADIRAATVVMLYLLPVFNLELRQRLRERLAPGTRIVSHAFDMGDWPPTDTHHVDGRQIYLWTVPG